MPPPGVGDPPPGADDGTPTPAGSGDPAYNAGCAAVGRVPPPGVGVPPPGVGVPSPGANDPHTPAASGDAAYNGVPAPPDEPPPRRLRRLHRVWPDRDGNISYLITLCVEGRARVLANEATFDRLVAFLLDGPSRYQWFPRRFVVMPDHLHLIIHQGREAIRLGQWVKALKAVVGGLKRREDLSERPVGPGDAGSGDAESGDAGSGDPAYKAATAPVGRVPSPGVGVPLFAGAPHEFTRLERAWRWQEGFHDHKFRTPEGEQRKWEYICLNPVRYRLVVHPEEWPFGGEIFYEAAGSPCLQRGTPPLLERGLLIEELPTSQTPDRGTPGQGTRPTG